MSDQQSGLFDRETAGRGGYQSINALQNQLAKSVEPAIDAQEAKYLRIGAKFADQMTDQLLSDVLKHMKDAFIELYGSLEDAEVEATTAGYDTLEDMLSEMDLYREAVTQAAWKILEGMDNSFIMPVLDHR